MKRSKRTGFFISFEGGEGSGKSTQMRRLVQSLRNRRLPLVISREPGGTRLGRRIRTILLNPRIKKMSARTELLLYEADRAQHVDEVIFPALSAGKIVITDRFADSSTVYQGICRDIGLAWTTQLNDFATNHLSPDLIILLDLPESVGMKRVRSRRRLDRLEREKKPFHNQVRRGFLTLARKNAGRYVVINARGNEHEVALEIEKTVIQRLKRKGYPWALL